MAETTEFVVDPQELRRVAGAFEQAAARLAAAVSRFATSAQPNSNAFGLLPEAQAVHGRYLATAREAHDGLRAVHEAFGHSFAGGLRINAANYVCADQESTLG
jgi:hypothetical protein